MDGGDPCKCDSDECSIVCCAEKGRQILALPALSNEELRVKSQRYQQFYNTAGRATMPEPVDISDAPWVVDRTGSDTFLEGVSISGGTRFSNHFDDKVGLICAMYNDNSPDTDPVAIENRVGWDVVAMEGYRSVLANSVGTPMDDTTVHDAELAKIKYIVHDTIVNEGTSMLMDEIYEEGDPAGQWIEREFGTDMYYALIGSPNGRGAAFILKDYDSLFKKKRQAKIYTYKSKGPDPFYYLLIEYVDID